MPARIKAVTFPIPVAGAKTLINTCLGCGTFSKTLFCDGCAPPLHRNGHDYGNHRLTPNTVYKSRRVASQVNELLSPAEVSYFGTDQEDD